MALLSDVFSTLMTKPTHTYVDRGGLDSKFPYALKGKKHIVVYGASKQGKSVLWKRHLPEDQSITVRCHHESSTEDLYADILRQLGTHVPKEYETEARIKTNVPKMPFHGEGRFKEKARAGGEKAPLVNIVLSELKKQEKRVIIEDFHYLSADEQRHFSFHLKSFVDEGIPFIIVGVWPNQNLLTLYNGDLRGRVEEFNLHWNDRELRELLLKGEDALNFKFTGSVRDMIIARSYNHVGLLNRVAEKICEIRGIRETLIGRPPAQTIDDLKEFNQACSTICSGEDERYNPLLDLISRGFRKADGVSLYAHILAVSLQVEDKDLLNGLSTDTIKTKIDQNGRAVQSAKLRACLESLAKLQCEKKISPPIFFFNKDSDQLYVTEPEFMFYRTQRKGKIRDLLSVTLKCGTCGESFLDTNPKNKQCGECKTKMSIVMCKTCGQNFITTDSASKECPKCSPLGRMRNRNSV